MPVPLLIPLIGAGIAAAGAAGGAIGSASNRSKAKKTMNSWYDYAEGYANTQRNLSTFDTPGGKALLKIANRNYADNLDSINNQIMAGGGTMENALAARQANNENRDKVNMQVLQADQKRRDAWDNQLLDIKGQRANYTANNYLQAAQDWQQWGGQMASAGMSLMNAGLLGGTGGISSFGIDPASVEGSGANVFGAAVTDFKNQTPTINVGSIPAAMGGLGDLTRHGKA